MARDGVPVGTTVEIDWTDYVIYPGAIRKFWVHVPARYEPAEPAGLTVCQNGQWYNDPDRDNLMHSGHLPSTVGAFIDPGDYLGADEVKNRSAEYDASDDHYVNSLFTETAIAAVLGATRQAVQQRFRRP